MTLMRSGWVVSERYRFRATVVLPSDIREYIESHARPEAVRLMLLRCWCGDGEGRGHGVDGVHVQPASASQSES